MYCTGCGAQLNEPNRFCPMCGRSTESGGSSPPQSPGPERRLVRPMHEKSIGGVCAGFARYLGVDVTLLRVVWLCTAIFLVGTGFLVYLICWIVIPADHSGSPVNVSAGARAEQPGGPRTHPEPASEPQRG